MTSLPLRTLPETGRPATSGTTVVLADPARLFRSSLGLALGAAGPFRALEAEDVEGALAQVRMSGAQVVLAHQDLPGGGLSQLCAGLDSLSPSPRVLALAEYADHAGLLSALELGAQGYLSKECRLDEFVDAVRQLERGEAVVPPAMLGGLLSDLVLRRRQVGEDRDRLGTLSRQERRVLEFLARGLNQEGIARELVISPQTARTHIQNVIAKLGVHSRIEAVAVAFEHGLVEAS